MLERRRRIVQRRRTGALRKREVGKEWRYGERIAIRCVNVKNGTYL
jgi:hypothetical protein